MARPRGRRARPPSPIAYGGNLLGLVGWVFADTLLALAVIFLAAQDGGIQPASAPAPLPTQPRSDRAPGVDTDFVCFRVVTSPDALAAQPSALAQLRDQVATQLAAAGLVDRRAGLVLSFGVGATPNEGTALASQFNAAVLPLFPSVFRSSTGTTVASRPFWGGRPGAAQPAGSVAVNVYPIVDADHGPIGRSGGDC